MSISKLFWKSLLFLGLVIVTSARLPKNYEYFTSDGIKSGLNADQTYFKLNEKEMRIYSGAMHYFRVPRAYWKDRLLKIRGAGLNAVETYVPWNLHEPQSGKYDFGDGGSEMEDFLHLEEFLQTAQEMDLFVIIRSGPYICAEYNFGGFPSWLLREKEIGFRSSESTFMKYVSRYFNVLLPILSKYQFTKGGPIIAFQVENEYDYLQTGDKAYLEGLNQLFVDNGIVELLVTSGNPARFGTIGTLPGTFLNTANFGDSPDDQISKLQEQQPDRPIMVMEYWIGWFDFWTDSTHNVKTVEKSKSIYEEILAYNASVNIYMFHGGTNFWFNNGASYGNGLLDNSGFKPITTSYDYDAPLTEDGRYTQKYHDVASLLSQYNPVQTLIPDHPITDPLVAYPSVKIIKQLPLSDIIEKNAPYVIESENVVAMEMLPINNNSGQSVGYTVYRKENLDIEAKAVLKIEGHVSDTFIVLLNGELIAPSALSSAADFDGFGYWRVKDPSVKLTESAVKGATLDIVVEEWGRPNGGSQNQYNHSFKGLWQGDVYLDDEKLTNWKITPLEFKKEWTNNLEGWGEPSEKNEAASLYYADLEIADEPSDTYINMDGWSKGLVTINGFPLGKYSAVGPQQTLYLPAPFLKNGTNQIIVFEQFKPSDVLTFSDKQIFRT